MVVADGDVDVCDFDPGYDVAATVHTSLRTLTEIWRGDLSWERATGNGASEDRGAHQRPTSTARLDRSGLVRRSPQDRLMSYARASTRRLRTWVDERDFSGHVLMTEGGEVVFEGSYGPADRSTSTPVTPATRFGLASVTKMFTAVTIADLVTAGAVTFETPVVDVLPPDRRPSTLLPEVTVHHLLVPHLGDRRLLRGGRGLTGVPRGLRLAVGAHPVVLDRTARRLPAALRRPAAVPPAGHAVPVLQRRLHRARPGHRGAHRTPVHRGRAGAGLRPRRHDGERLLAPRRGTAGRRRRLPAAFGTRRAVALEHLQHPDRRRRRRRRLQHRP